MTSRGHDPHQGSYAILLRRITATIILAITLTLSAVACTPAQVTAFFDARGQTIDQPTASYVAQALTRWDNEQRMLLAYLAAVDQARHQDLVWRWSGVAQCESGGNWAINTGNGYYGGVQFLLSTWRSVGGSGYPHQNSPGEQAYRAEILRQRSGLGQWPVCGRYYRG